MSAQSYSVSEEPFPVKDHLSIHYSDYRPSAENNAVPVVYLPGLMRTARDFDRVAKRIAAERRVITIDTRGRGKAGRSDDPADYAFDVMIDDVWKLLDHLRVEKFVLVGLALGAFMAWRMAGQEPKRVVGIVINDTGYETFSKAGKKMVALADQDLHDFDVAVEKLRAPNQKNFRDLGLDDWRALTRQVYAEVEPGKWKRDFHPAILEAWQETKAQVPSLWDDCLKIGDVPVVVLRGEGSEYLPTEHAEKLKHELKNARTVEVQGRAHPLLLDEPASLIALREVLDAADRQA